ncbi:MAG TPA: HIT domain-containing protein [Armatimonadota bacterium]|nr:HIT domain-containing protein [Armatimonadota bacterium]
MTDDQHGPECLHAPWRMAYIAGAGKPTGGCIFCDKPKEDRDRENGIIHRGERTFIILNAYPYNNGHLMVVPYRHTHELGELDPATQQEMLAMAALAIEALRKVICPDGFNLGANLGRVAGAGIAVHLHLHVVPRWDGDTNFMLVVSNTRVLPESLEITWEKLTAAVRDIRAGAPVREEDCDLNQWPE